MTVRAKVQTRIALPTKRALDAHCSRSGKSQGAVIDAALQAFFDDTTDAALLYRRLDRSDRSVSQVKRDLELLTEAFALFLQTWFAHTPRLSEAERSPAAQSAQTRILRFQATLAERLAGGGRFVNEVASDLATDPTALHEAVEALDNSE